MTREGSQTSPGGGRRETPAAMGWNADSREKSFYPSSSLGCQPFPGSFFPCNGISRSFFQPHARRQNCQKGSSGLLPFYTDVPPQAASLAASGGSQNARQLPSTNHMVEGGLLLMVVKEEG